MGVGTGFPGYNSLMPKANGTIAQVLKGDGYNTVWYGNNHNVPDWHSSQAGPFDLWPTGFGFEQFFGFIGGFLLIFGARMAGGCTSGLILSGGMQLAKSGLIFEAFVFVAFILTGKLFYPGSMESSEKG